MVRVGAETYYDYGQAPASFLVAFGSRRAFIYVLEIVAQVLALTTLARRLPERWLAFIDNVAGQWALTKGYGRDPAVNGVLAAFWSQAAETGWLPDFRRVPSKANVADAVSKPRGSSRHRSGSSGLGWSWFCLSVGSPFLPCPFIQGSVVHAMATSLRL